MMNDLAENPRAVSGHNQPPEDPLDGALARLSQLEAAGEKWQATNVNTLELAQRLADYDAQCLRLWQSCKTLHDAEKKPHLDAGRAVDRRWSGPMEAIETRRKLIGAKLTAYNLAVQRKLDAERAEARRKAEEARRAAEEATAKAERKPGVDTLKESMQAAAHAVEADQEVAKIPDRARIPAGLSGRARSLIPYPVGEITDIDMVFERYRDTTDTFEALNRQLQAEIRGTKGQREIPGVTIKTEYR